MHRARNSLYISLCDMVVNQAFLITECGYIGIGPPNTRAGDEVWVLFGGNTPFVLRKKDEKLANAKCRERSFIGDAYVHGIMAGEAVVNCDGNETTVLLV